MNDKIELLPCPFCGCEAQLSKSIDYSTVFCTKCSARVGLYYSRLDYSVPDNRPAQAVNRWNNRIKI